MAKNTVNAVLYEDINWNKLCGAVPIRMTNDYLFRALLQRNNKVLKALVCSLLHLDADSVGSVQITNPIELGKSISNKDFFLDIRVEINHHTILNLELQVLNEKNWPERSLSYLCRIFDNLNHGEEYLTIRPAIQIGILDFSLFPDFPEFYSSYSMRNDRNYKIYSSKFRLFVLDLTQIELATEEDRHYQIDRWARLFKSTTWEELKMLAENDTAIQEAVSTVYQLSEDEKIRLQCEAREEYYRIENTRRLELEQALSEREQAFIERDQAIAKLDRAFIERDQAIAKLDRAFIERDQAIAKLDRAIKELEQTKEYYRQKLIEHELKPEQE